MAKIIEQRMSFEVHSDDGKVVKSFGFDPKPEP
jgi:hypothetical protein